jgi:sulfite reductase beta subunit
VLRRVLPAVPADADQRSGALQARDLGRIGWPRFFERTGLTFTKYLIDDWRGARASLNASTHIRF